MSIEDVVTKEPRGHRFFAREKREEKTRVLDVEKMLRILLLRMRKLEKRVSELEECSRRKK